MTGAGAQGHGEWLLKAQRSLWEGREHLGSREKWRPRIVNVLNATELDTVYCLIF